MVEKCFKIVSNSQQYLTAELVSEALLNYFTLDPTKPDVVFGVIEKKSHKEKGKGGKAATKYNLSV